ncbi:MAG: DUF3107 domain-containing protein [Acidimicrobiales bacterium]
MDVRIGVLHTMKEIEIELPDGTDKAAVKSAVDEALADDDKVLWLTDKNGREVGIPSERVAWVEFGRPDAERRIGFGS